MKAHAAVDLWSQLIERARRNDWSTFEDPTYNGSTRRREEEAEVERAFLAAGWTSKEVGLLREVQSRQLDSTPVTTPGVAKHSELLLQRTRRIIIAGLTPSQKAIAETAHFAVEPKAGPFVMTTNVPLTDQTIITMGTHFTRYCGLVARAYARTLNKALGITGNDFDERLVRLQLRKNPDLLFYWWRIFTSFSLTGTNVLVPFKPSTKHEVLLMEQVALAMETFALAHELGHHCLRHGRRLTSADDAKVEEFEADKFAARVCERVEGTERHLVEQGHPLTNPYLWTGAGGILLLGSLEIFRKVKAKIFHNPVFDTHPEFDERAQRIGQLSILEPVAHVNRQEFCGSVRNVLSCVLMELQPIMEAWPFEVYRSLLPQDWEEESFRQKASFL